MTKKTNEQPLEVQEEEVIELYYEQNITINAAEGSTVTIHINQSGEPRNEPPRP